MQELAPVLVVDDEPSICWGFEQMLDDEGIPSITTSSAEEGLQLAEQYQPSLIILDVRLPGMDGLTALPKFKAISPDSAVVIMTAFGDLQTAVQAIRNGAADYLTKPFGIERAKEVCRAVLDQQAIKQGLTSSPSDVRSPPDDVRLVGSSPKMRALYGQVAKIAASDWPVLIVGEQGTGKKLIAAAIHGHSQRKHRPYIAVSANSVDPQSVERELFGYVASTDGDNNEPRDGAIALADGGTLYFDNIESLPLSTQAKLASVITHGSYTPIGSTQSCACNVRIIASSRLDLSVAAAAGEFREDLLARLSAVTLKAPPLRDHVEDIELLVRHFLALARNPSAEQPLDPSVLQVLQDYDWPGNVQQLRSVVERAAFNAGNGPLAAAHLPALDDLRPPIPYSTLPSTIIATLQESVRAWADQTCADESAIDIMNQFLSTVEPPLLETVLRRSNGNRLAAAERLGIHRGTLRDRLRRYNIQP